MKDSEVWRQITLDLKMMPQIKITNSPMRIIMFIRKSENMFYWKETGIVCSILTSSSMFKEKSVATQQLLR